MAETDWFNKPVENSRELILKEAFKLFLQKNVEKVTVPELERVTKLQRANDTDRAHATGRRLPTYAAQPYKTPGKLADSRDEAAPRAETKPKQHAKSPHAW